MNDNTNNSVVAIFDTHDNAENAIKKLAEADISMKKLSVIGKGYHTDEKVVGFYNVGDRMKFWGKFGAFWGGLWGLMAGGLYLAVPIIGPVIVLGHFAVVLVAALEGAVEGAVLFGGASALSAALFSIGIPKDTVLQYEEALKADEFLILMHGTAEEAKHARAILKATNAKQVDMHCCQNKSMNEPSVLKMKAAS